MKIFIIAIKLCCNITTAKNFFTRDKIIAAHTHTPSGKRERESNIETRARRQSEGKVNERERAPSAIA